VKAIFATRCGCQQAFEVPYPPPPEVLLPLGPKREWSVYSPDADVSALPATPPNPVETRRFVLKSMERRRTPSDEAYYAEE
jgi:hypothetical protein